MLALLAALLATGPAFAEADAARKEAAARFQEGLALHDANNDEEARLKFAQAYALNRSPVSPRIRKVLLGFVAVASLLG